MQLCQNYKKSSEMVCHLHILTKNRRVALTIGRGEGDTRYFQWFNERETGVMNGAYAPVKINSPYFGSFITLGYLNFCCLHSPSRLEE